jgi:hypothetical protein
LFDEGFNFDVRKLKLRHADITRTQTHTILREPDAASHLCTTAQHAANTCNPYLEINFQSSSTINTVVRIHPTLVQTMGEVGGTCEIIVFFSWMFYFQVFKKRNTQEQNRRIWFLN